jgi:hypothetical protein
MAFGERIGSTWASMRAHPIWSAALVVLAAAASGFFASLWDKLLFERFTAPLAQWIGDAAASLVTTALTLVVAMALVAGVIAATAWLTWRVTSATINPHHNAPPSDGGSAYWTLTEAISWIAFGDAVEATGWPALLQRMQINAAEERHRFMAAERAFIMKMRDPNAGIDIVGKEDGKDGIHMPIPHYVFLSDIGLSILDNRI